MGKSLEKIKELIKLATIEQDCIKSNVSFFKAYIHRHASPNTPRILKPALDLDKVGFSIFMICYDSKEVANYVDFSTETLNELGFACQDYLLNLLPRIVSIQLNFDLNSDELTILQQTPEELDTIYNSLFSQLILSSEDFKDECFGEELAQKIASKLKLGFRLENIHPDYCGTGLRFFNYQFDYIEINNHDKILMSFPTEKSFINWLSQQSDRSMARLEEPNQFLHGNQVINKKRLLQFVAVGD